MILLSAPFASSPLSGMPSGRRPTHKEKTVSAPTNHAVKTVAIQSGIPIPPPRSSKGPEPKWKAWPFVELMIGQSFLMEGETLRYAAVLSMNASKFLRRKFTTRVIEGEAGPRIWRTD